MSCPSKVSRPTTEAEVQATCLALLRARGVVAFRSNNRVFRVPGKGGRERLLKVGLGKGSSDLVGILPGGRWLSVECKRPGERPDHDQLAWLTGINRAGGLALWVDDPATLDTMFAGLEACRERDGLLVVRFEDRARVVFAIREGSFTLTC